MAVPQTAFDSPQFDLLPDEIRRTYVNVDNELIWISSRGTNRKYLVVVPAKFFTIAREVLKVPVGDAVELYIVSEGDYYVFGAAWGESGVTDLWYYTPKTLPGMFKR